MPGPRSTAPTLGSENLTKLFGADVEGRDALTSPTGDDAHSSQANGSPADALTHPPVEPSKPTQPDVDTDALRVGVFGFPQPKARVLRDDSQLRLSVWNNSEYLYLQAVLWTDNDRTLGSNHDFSSVALDLDGDRMPARNDRYYTLNPRPDKPGMWYQAPIGEQSMLQNDSRGRGAIRYVKTPQGDLVRVDSFLIPLDEIRKKPGESVRLGYRGVSPKPKLQVHSLGNDAKRYRPAPWAIHPTWFLDITLSNVDSPFDPQNVPRGRDAVPVDANSALEPSG